MFNRRPAAIVQPLGPSAVAAIAALLDRGRLRQLLTEDEGEDRIRASYGANLDRLERVTAAWDPDNVFRLNKNIEPRA
jgi:hypothetical protein